MKPLKLADACFSIALAAFLGFLIVGIGVRLVFGITASSAPRAHRVLDFTAGILLLITVGAVLLYVVGWVADYVRRHFR